MRALISSSELLEDNWVTLNDSQAIDKSNNLVVSLGRLQQQWDQLSDLSFGLGVLLEPTDAVEAVLPFLDRLSIIVLQFKVFSDGRAFSQARLLRDRYDYCGAIRAVGDVLCDQLWFMRRSGISQFELAEGEDLELAFSAFSEISFTYQTELKQPCVG